jgi:hypothetical protein
MKLKYAVSLIALSVASTSALAAAQSTGQGSSTAFQSQQLYAMTNDTGVLPMVNWYNHIGLSGLLNLDVFTQKNDKYLGLTAVNNTQGTLSAFNVSTLALNLDSQINNWVAAHVGLFYATSAQPNGISGANGVSTTATRYYEAAEAGGANGNINGVDVDDAYVDIMDLNKAPVDVRIGRQYFGYGSYDRYAMMPTLTQQLTEIRGTGLQFAYLGASGLHADAFALRGIQGGKFNPNGSAVALNDGNQIRNFGGTIGYTSVISKIGFDVSAGYLYNIDDVGAIAQHYSTANGFSSRSGAWNANAAMMMGPFKLGLQYAATLAKMKDFSWNETSTAAGARLTSSNPSPNAGNVYASYAFKTAGYNSKLTGGYQWSSDALMQAGSITNSGTVGAATAFSLPESRVAAEYDVNVLQNTMVGLEVNYDSAYSKAHGGTGVNSLTGIGRISVLL